MYLYNSRVSASHALASCGCLLLALRFGVCSVYCCSRLLERRRVAHQLLPVILACLEVSLGVGGLANSLSGSGVDN